MNYFYYFISLISAIILFSTTWPRINAIDLRKNRNKRDIARALGMIAVAIGSVMTMFAAELAPVVLIVGMALCWLNTPGHPPWWKYMSKGDHYYELKRRVDDA